MSDGGMYKGHRADGCEYFDDIMGDNSVPDIFATPMGGMKEYEGIKAEVVPTGVVVSLNCRPPGCGHRREVNISWGELCAIAHAPQTNWLPPGWARSEPNQAAYPTTTCACGQPVAPMIRPQWAGSQVDAALQGGLVSQQMLQADPIVQQLQQRVQQAQMQQPQQQQGYPPR